MLTITNRFAVNTEALVKNIMGATIALCAGMMFFFGCYYIQLH